MLCRGVIQIGLSIGESLITAVSVYRKNYQSIPTIRQVITMPIQENINRCLNELCAQFRAKRTRTVIALTDRQALVRVLDMDIDINDQLIRRHLRVQALNMFGRPYASLQIDYGKGDIQKGKQKIFVIAAPKHTIHGMIHQYQKIFKRLVAIDVEIFALSRIVTYLEQYDGQGTCIVIYCKKSIYYCCLYYRNRLMLFREFMCDGMDLDPMLWENIYRTIQVFISNPCCPKNNKLILMGMGHHLVHLMEWLEKKLNVVVELATLDARKMNGLVANINLITLGLALWGR